LGRESFASGFLRPQSLAWAQWLFLALVAVVPGTLEFTGRSNHQAFVAAARETHGSVLARLRNNHNFVRYEYSVAGRKYQGEGKDWVCGREAQVGATVPVLYLADRPAESVVGTPSCFIGGLGSVLAAGLFGLVCAGLGFIVLSAANPKARAL
jgi:hypothetical protein